MSSMIDLNKLREAGSKSDQEGTDEKLVGAEDDDQMQSDVEGDENKGNEEEGDNVSADLIESEENDINIYYEPEEIEANKQN